MICLGSWADTQASQDNALGIQRGHHYINLDCPLAPRRYSLHKDCPDKIWQVDVLRVVLHIASLFSKTLCSQCS